MNYLFNNWSVKLNDLMQRKPKTAALEGLAKAMQPDATMLSSTCTRHTLQCLDKGSAKLSVTSCLG